MLEWVAYPFSSGSSWPRSQTGVSCTAGGLFTNRATRELTWFAESHLTRQWHSQLLTPNLPQLRERETGFQPGLPAAWLLVVCSVSLVPSPHSPLWSLVQTQTLHSGNGSHHSTLAKPLESDPDKPWWGDPVRSASWRPNSNEKLRRKNDTAKKECQVLLTKTVERLLGEGSGFFNIFLPWQPKNLGLSTSIHPLWHFFFQNSGKSYDSKTKNLVQVHLQDLLPKC